VTTAGRMYDVPPLGRPLPLRGLRVTVTLDEFAPTGVDAWYGRAVVGSVTYPAVVVRRAGDVVRRGLLTRRGSVPGNPPEPGAVLGIVVDAEGATAAWHPPGDPSALARTLSA
jgi:hypothetical protein